VVVVVVDPPESPVELAAVPDPPVLAAAVESPPVDVAAPGAFTPVVRKNISEFYCDCIDDGYNRVLVVDLKLKKILSHAYLFLLACDKSTIKLSQH
jgi:hypothetical protein